MVSFIRRLFLAKRSRKFSAFNVLLKMLLKQGKFNIACYLIDKLLAIFKLYIYTFWQKRKIERITKINNQYLNFLLKSNKYIQSLDECLLLFQKLINNNFNLKHRFYVFFCFFFLKKFSRYIPKLLFIFNFFSYIKLPLLNKSEHNNYTLKNKYLFEFLSNSFPLLHKFNKGFVVNSIQKFFFYFFQQYGCLVSLNNFSGSFLYGKGSNKFIMNFYMLFKNFFLFLFKLFKFKSFSSKGENQSSLIFVEDYSKIQKFFLFDNIYLKSKHDLTKIKNKT